VYEEPYQAEAWKVSREMVRRMHHNLDLLLPRLEELGYRFGAGYYDQAGPEEWAILEAEAPRRKLPTAETKQLLDAVEAQIGGKLPMLVRCWYEHIGGVNLVGLFPDTEERTWTPSLGVVLDPLFLFPLEVVAEKCDWDDFGAGREWFWDVCPDRFFKYGVSGGGPNALLLRPTFDTFYLPEHHSYWFGGQYLRRVFQYGGFHGIPDADEQVLSPEVLAFLTRDFLPF